jgi:hypothetical protein
MSVAHRFKPPINRAAFFVLGAATKSARLQESCGNRQPGKVDRAMPPENGRLLSAGDSEPFPNLPHNFVNLKREHGVRFFFQLGTPSGQDSVLARFVWCETEFVGNLLYRRFPGFEIHRSIL